MQQLHILHCKFQFCNCTNCDLQYTQICPDGVSCLRETTNGRLLHSYSSTDTGLERCWPEWPYTIIHYQILLRSLYFLLPFTIWSRNMLFIHSFIHSFIQAISLAPLQVHYYSEALPTQHGYCVGVSHRRDTGNCEWRNCPRSLHVRVR